MTTGTENAFVAVEQLIEMIMRLSHVAAFAPGDGDFGVFTTAIRLSFDCDTTVIEKLQKLTRAHEGDDPEERGTACEARDALLALPMPQPRSSMTLNGIRTR